MKTIKTEFWSRWEKANELEKVKLVESLPIYAKGKICCPLFSPSLINSYFEDLYLYVKGDK